MAGTAGRRSTDLGTALRAQRDHLVACLAECPPDKAAPLHARLTDILLKLDGMAVPKGSTSDDLKKRRAERLKARRTA